MEEEAFSNADLDDAEEENLAGQLKELWDKGNHEKTDPTKFAAIFHKIAKIYEKRAFKSNTHQMICFIKSAALYNAAIIRNPENTQEIKYGFTQMCTNMLRVANASCKGEDLEEKANSIAAEADKAKRKNPKNEQEIKNDFKKLCTNFLEDADASCKGKELVEKANSIAEKVNKMRTEVNSELRELELIEKEELQLHNKESRDRKKVEAIEKLQRSIATSYTNIMISVAKESIKLIGAEPPCEFSLAGMGSLAKYEITPYSNFENMILLDTKLYASIKDVSTACSSNADDSNNNLSTHENSSLRKPAACSSNSDNPRQSGNASDSGKARIEENSCEKKYENFSDRGQQVRLEGILNYFRWFSVIFQIILISLGETIIPGVSISFLNDKNSKFGDWFHDRLTKRGISFDGMMPHACKFPLGRQHLTKDKPWKTELIKPVNEMLKYLNTKESLKNGYHLSTILTKTCHVYGNVKIFEQFQNGICNLIESEREEAIVKSVKKQISEDLVEYATRQSLSKIQPSKRFNVKQVVYRSLTTLISELGRLYKVSANSCFEILNKLAEKEMISETSKNRLRYAVALACEIRLKWYMKCERQNDSIDSMEQIWKLIGKPATLTLFRITYALQCDISKRLNLKKRHLYSNPKLLNARLLSFNKGFAEQHDQMENLLQVAKHINSTQQRYYAFDLCLADLEESISSGKETSLGCKLTDSLDAKSNFFHDLGEILMQLKCYDDALECFQNTLNLLNDRVASTEDNFSNFSDTSYDNSYDVSIETKRGYLLQQAGICMLKVNRFKEAERFSLRP